MPDTAPTQMPSPGSSGMTDQQHAWLQTVLKLTVPALAGGVPGAGKPAHGKDEAPRDLTFTPANAVTKEIGGKPTETKTPLSNGKSLTGTTAAGGNVKVEVKQNPAADPPKFSITTTISFKLSAGRSGSKEAGSDNEAARKDPENLNPGTDKKIKVGASASASAGGSASFKRDLSQQEAEDYLDAVKNNGKGGKLPEHRIMLIGVTQGWDVAKGMWANTSGSPTAVAALKPGEELESTFEASASVGGNVAGNIGVVNAGVSGEKTLKHTISIKKAATSDGKTKVTVTVKDAHGTNAGVTAGAHGISGAHDTTRTDSAGKGAVFILDPADKSTYAAQLQRLDKLQSAEELEALKKDKSFKLAEQTEETGHGEGDKDSIGNKDLKLAVFGKADQNDSVTTDADGKVLRSKTEATNQSGGELTVKGVKLAASRKEGMTAETKDGVASATLSATDTESDIGKSVRHALASNKNMVDAAKAPDKAVQETSSTEDLHLNHDELTQLATLALDEGKWRGQVGGKDQDDWVQAGEKLRAAIKQEHGKVVSINMVAANKAFGNWMAGKYGHREEVLQRLARPHASGDDHAVGGKADAFPQGTVQYQPLFNALVVSDPLAPVRAKAKTDPKGALADLQGVKKQLSDLQLAFRTDSGKWSGGHEAALSEMTGLLVGRVNDANTATREIGKALLAPMADAAKGKGPEAAAAKGAVRQARDADIEAMATNYRNNFGQMTDYKKTVFGQLFEAEQGMAKGAGFFEHNDEPVKKAYKIIGEVNSLIQIWKQKYDETYKMYQQLSQSGELDEADLKKLEQLHIAGAQQQRDKVNTEMLAGGKVIT